MNILYLSSKQKLCTLAKVQKWSPIGVLLNRCSSAYYKIHRRTPMRKCDFNKVDMQNIIFVEHLWDTSSECCFLWNLICSRVVYPVDTWRRFNVYKTSIRRLTDVETTLCVYWIKANNLLSCSRSCSCAIKANKTSDMYSNKFETKKSIT